MAYTIYQLLNMDVKTLAEKNHTVASLFVASMDNVLERCSKRGSKPKTVRFSVPRKLASGRIAIDVNY